ncbi:Slp family lipoprotein [Petrachloros mirabilis]
MTQWPIMNALLGSTLMLTACAESAHQTRQDAEQSLIPKELEQQIDTSIDFPALVAAPDQYIGRVVMFSGLVLSSKRTASQTEIELLELPARSGPPNTNERIQSRGRFLATQSTFLDPAIVAPGTPLTIVGEVTGKIKRPLDESEYTYPVIAIRHFIDWNTVASQYGAQSDPVYYGPSYFYPYPYWWGPYAPYPYWAPYPPVIIQRPLPPPPPPPPPPSRIPPQFRKR